MLLHLTKKALESKEAVYEILVDNVTAKENVSRFAQHQGYTAEAEAEAQGEDFLIRLKK